uniref:Uncharacterized protein n=1 Tax=Candidatus Kentrum sp. FW TaxID=2126338 RepID=A0A450T6J4_9GAMM|nr:MAG: hypothetical protein BECKFW1821B_GA0114236_107014 [Candidatus Kentron sp. FW]
MLSGGEKLPDGRYTQGFWFEPTIMAVDKLGITAAREEIFSLVPIVQRFGDFPGK